MTDAPEVTITDTRCPRCFQRDLVNDDGTVTPHRRLSTGGVWTWCRRIVRRREIPTTCRPDGGRFA